MREAHKKFALTDEHFGIIATHLQEALQHFKVNAFN
jgi:hypothetical protein